MFLGRQQAHNMDTVAKTSDGAEPSTTELQDVVNSESASYPEATKESAQDLEWANNKRNPHNWPMSKRFYHALIPAAFGFVV